MMMTEPSPPSPSLPDEGGGSPVSEPQVSPPSSRGKDGEGAPGTQMRRAVVVLPAGSWREAEPVATVTLPFEQRYRRRLRMLDDAGEAFLLDLDRPVLLADGDGLGLEGGGVIHVRARRFHPLALPRQPITQTGSGYRMRVTPEDEEPPALPKSHDFR